jgi:hypothetical protein
MVQESEVQAMARVQMQVTVDRIGSYTRQAYMSYSTETVYIYTLKDEAGTAYVWKTTAILGKGEPEVDWHRCNTGDVITIKATIKGESEYKGEPQTLIQRVTVVSVDFKAETWEERKERLEREREARAEAQRNSLDGEDWIWNRMPYKQYKEHYSDCETIEGSFSRARSGQCFVDVIIREGRLKKSGVRGEEYYMYELVSDSGESVTYKAVCEENALRRAAKEHPGQVWEVHDEWRVRRGWIQ